MKKKLTTFTYEKEQGNVKEHSIFLIAADDKSLSGFDVAAMSDEEYTELINIQEKHEASLDPYMKYFRKFSTSKILTLE